jgi:hypothetical protein
MGAPQRHIKDEVWPFRRRHAVVNVGGWCPTFVTEGVGSEERCLHPPCLGVVPGRVMASAVSVVAGAGGTSERFRLVGRAPVPGAHWDQPSADGASVEADSFPLSRSSAELLIRSMNRAVAFMEIAGCCQLLLTQRSCVFLGGCN